MELDSLISEIGQATQDLENAAADDFKLLAALLERRSALIARLHARIPAVTAGQLTGRQIDALRSALARGTFYSATLQMKRIEAAVSLEASMQQKALASSFVRPQASRVIDYCG